jgi:hypothetical protein
MKHTKKLILTILCVFLLAAAMVLAANSAFAARPEDVFVFDREAQDWSLKRGDEPEGTSGGDNDSGFWFYVVNPDGDTAAKGLEPGILLYDTKSDKYSFLPFEGEDAELITGVQNVNFSPDGRRAVVSIHMSRFFSQLTVYETETLQIENTFEMAYGDVFFIDDVRFAFTLIDNDIERPEEAGMWGTSAAIYEPADDDKGYVILRKATAKENFTVTGLTDENEIAINVTSVKSEKDWEDPDKQQDAEIVVEVPGAG